VVSSIPRPHFTPGKDPVPILHPGKDPVPILQAAGWAPGPVWTGGKCHPHGDSIPDRPTRSHSLYRLSFNLCVFVQTSELKKKTILGGILGKHFRIFFQFDRENTNSHYVMSLKQNFLLCPEVQVLSSPYQSTEVPTVRDGKE